MKPEIDGIRITQPLLDPNYQATSYIELPFSHSATQYIASLRHGDRVDFRTQEVSLGVSFVYLPPVHEEIKLASSDFPNKDTLGDLPWDEHVLPMHNDEDRDAGLLAEDDSIAVVSSNAHNLSTHKTNVETQDTNAPYSTSRERRSRSPQAATPDILRTQENSLSGVVKETPRRARLQQETSTLSRVQDSMPIRIDEEVHLPPWNRGRTEILETQSQRSLATGMPSVNLSNAEISNTMAEDDGMQHGRNGSAVQGPEVPTQTTDTHRSVHSEDDTEDDAEGNAEDDAEHDSEDDAEDDVRMKSSNNKHTEEGMHAADEIPIKSATLETPAPKTRGTKRKKSDDNGAALPTGTSTKKRAKRTEAELLLQDVDMDVSKDDEGDVPDGTPSGISRGRRRSSPRVMISQHDESPLLDGLSRILFPSESKITERKGLMNFLKTQKVKVVVDSKPELFDILCVEKGELRKTAKLLSSLVNNKTIVTDDWVVESSKSKRLLTPGNFLPEALKGTMNSDRSKVFEGMTIFFTPKLRADYKKGWDDIRTIAEQGGANVLCCVPSKIPEDAQVDLYLGSDDKDPHGIALQEAGKTVFHKSIIAQSIISGEVDYDGEHEMPEVVASASPASARDSGKAGKAEKTRKGTSKKKK